MNAPGDLLIRNIGQADSLVASRPCLIRRRLLTLVDELLPGAPALSPGDGPEGPQRTPWETLAEHWNLLGPPLRPGPQDMPRLRAAWVATLPDGVPERRIDILLLGVTPEAASFQWSPKASLTALDSSELMIRAVWPGDSPDRRVVQGEWLRAPFPDASFDLVLSDGGLVALGSHKKISGWSHEMSRVLRPDGRAVLRHFMRPEHEQSSAALVVAVASGEIRDFNVLKLRLLMALSYGRADGRVELSAAWEEFNRIFPHRAALAGQLGCPPKIISTIDAYRGRADGYVFPSESELSKSCAEFFVARGPDGHYPLAECCPVFSFTPNP